MEKVKLLQITNSLASGGAEKLVVETSLHFSKMGIEVNLLLLDNTQTPYFDLLRKDGKIKIFSFDKKLSIYSPIHIFNIKKHLKNYDVVHVHLFPSLYWSALAKMLGNNNTTLILTEHNTTNRRRKLWLFKILDRVVYHQYKKIITISNAVDESLKLHLGSSFSNLEKIYNGIDLNSFTNAIPYTKEELGFSVEDNLLIQVASFTKQKDQKTVIKALKQLPKSYHLLLVGDGPLKEVNITFTKEMELKERVHYLGLRSDIARLLKSVDVVVLSSHYEGLSLSSVEGMASGTPFVASRAPGLIEVVEDAGVLFPIGDYKKLALILLEITTKENYNLEVSKKCLERSRNFDIEEMVKSYMELYKNT